MAWNACNKMEKLWKSSLNRQIKIMLFRTTMEPILLYGSETWTLSARQHHRLDGCYTRLLRRGLNMSWKSHPSLKDIFADLPRISSLVRKRRVQFAGHCARASDELLPLHLLFIGGFHHHTDIIGRDAGFVEKNFLS